MKFGGECKWRHPGEDWRWGEYNQNTFYTCMKFSINKNFIKATWKYYLILGNNSDNNNFKICLLEFKWTMKNTSLKMQLSNFFKNLK